MFNRFARNSARENSWKDNANNQREIIISTESIAEETDLDREKLAEEIEQYRQAIDLAPKSPQAYLKLAQALKQQGRLEESAFYYRQAISLKASQEESIEEPKVSPPANFSQTNFVKQVQTELTFQSFPVTRERTKLQENLLDDRQPYNVSKYTQVEQQVSINNNAERSRAVFQLEAAQVYLQQAETYCEQGRWNEAIAACERSLAIAPRMAEAYKLWGNALQKMGNYPEAMGYYAKAIELQPDLVEVYANLGTLYAQKQEWQKAIEYYQKAINLKPDFAGVYRNLAKVWLNVGERQKAWECQFQALTLEPEQATAQEHFNLGNELRQQAWLQEAATCYRHAIELDPHLAKAYLNLAEVLEQLGEWQEAGMYYRQVLNLSSTGLENNNFPQNERSQMYSQPSFDRNLLTGIPQERKQLPSADPAVKVVASTVNANPQNNIEDAIHQYTKAAILEPESAEIQANLGSLYAQHQQWNKAIACYKQALALDSNLAGVYRNLARALTQIGNQDEAADCWEKALSLEPNWAKAEQHLQLGKLLFEQGKPEKAINCYRRTLQLKPDLSEAYHLLGDLLFKQGNKQEAIAVYRECLKHNDRDIESYSRLGKVWLQMEQWQDVISCYQKIVELQPDNWQAYHNLGDAWLKQQLWERAESAYSKAVELNPLFFWSYQNLGTALLELKRWEDSARALRKAIELNRDFALSYYNLGEALVQLAEWDEAIAAYQCARQLQSDLPQVEQKLSQAISKRNKLNAESLFNTYLRAIEQNPTDVESYRQAIEIHPDNAKLHLGLGNALVAHQKLEEAIEAYRHAIQLDPNAIEAYRQLAQIASKQEKWQEAIACYRKTIELDPDDADLHYCLGECLLEQQQWEEAIAAYRLALEVDPELEIASERLNYALEQLNPPEIATVTIVTEEIEEEAIVEEEIGEIVSYQEQEEGESEEDIEEALEEALEEAIEEDIEWAIQEDIVVVETPVEVEETSSSQQIFLEAIYLAEKILLLKLPNSIEIKPDSQIRLSGQSIHKPYYWQTIVNKTEEFQILLLSAPHLHGQALLTDFTIFDPQSFGENQLSVAEIYPSYPEHFNSFFKPLLSECVEEILATILKATSNSSEIFPAPELLQVCQLMRENVPDSKLILNQGFWLTPSILYFEGEIKQKWVLGNKPLLLLSQDTCEVTKTYFWQISHKEFAAIAVFDKEIYTKPHDVYYLTVLADGKPISLDGQVSQKGFNLEFIAHLNQKTEHQKHLIRENLSRAIVEMIPQQQKQEVSGLLNKLQYFVYVTPVGFGDPNLPFKFFLDYIFPIQCDGLFLAGWMHDPYEMLEEIEAISDLGFSLSIAKDDIYYVDRLDVNQHLENTPYGGFDGKLGFCTYAKVPEKIRQAYENLAELHGFRFKIKLRGRIELEVIPQMKHNDVFKARKTILQIPSLAAHQAIRTEILENCIIPAASKLQHLCISQIKVKELFYVGTPVADPLVSIVIPLYKQLDFIKIQLATMANDPSMSQCELIYVLDSPEQEKGVKDILYAYATLYELPVTLVVMERNSGYAAANNHGAIHARAPYLILLNSDVIPKHKGWATKMAEFYASSPKMGAMAPKLLYEDQALQHAGMYFEKTKFPFWLNLHYYKGFPSGYEPATISRPVPAVTGACLMISRELYQEIGGLCTEYIIGDFEDSDLCLKCADLGYENWYFADVELYHLERQSMPLSAVYSASLAWQCNGLLHTHKWNSLIEKIMQEPSFK